jgi:hypothetical protein
MRYYIQKMLILVLRGTLEPMRLFATMIRVRVQWKDVVETW